MKWLKKIFSVYRVEVRIINGSDVFTPQWRQNIFSKKWFPILPGLMNWTETLEDAKKVIFNQRDRRKEYKKHAKTIKHEYY